MIERSLGEGSAAKKEIQGLFTIADDGDVIGQFFAAQCMYGKVRVVRAVFY